MIYVTGDCHADWKRFSSKWFPEQKEMTRDDFVIVCGDFGIWHDTSDERWWLDWLSEKPFTICFVDGNHENFDRLYSDEFETVDFHGGKAHRIRENVFHLIRGYVFEFDGKKFFAFGGASSHDIKDGILEPIPNPDGDGYIYTKELVHEYNTRTSNGEMLRINHLSWWKEEMPSKEEMDFGLKTLEKNDFEVDYIITHCCPQHIASVFSEGCYKPDALTKYFNDVSRKTKFNKWYFGHYHDDTQIMGKYVMNYYYITRIL